MDPPAQENAPGDPLAQPAADYRGRTNLDRKVGRIHRPLNRPAAWSDKPSKRMVATNGHGALKIFVGSVKNIQKAYGFRTATNYIRNLVRSLGNLPLPQAMDTFV